MPSSISSSEAAFGNELFLDRPGFVQQTASDRPGVAQPVPERHLPNRPWGRVFGLAAFLFVALMAGWEFHWRDYGAVPSYLKGDGSWAAQRRRIDQGEGGGLVLIGSSRTHWDIQLPVWQQVTGEKPIQLAVAGTTPISVLEDLAADPHFTGRLAVGVAPDLFFSSKADDPGELAYSRKETPSQRIGHWLSQRLVESRFAYYDPDFALVKVIKRQNWPVRDGTHPRLPVRKLTLADADRNTHLWWKVETDLDYREMARNVWRQNFIPPKTDEDRENRRRESEEIVDRAAAAVAKLRRRGVKLVFLRLPSDGEYKAFEDATFPRATTWDLLLRKTGTPGIHFEDHPELQGYYLPEWSHIATADARRMTARLAPLVQKAFEE